MSRWPANSSPADAVIWLFTVDQAGKASELEALHSIRSAGKQILGVLNKIDRLPQMTESADGAPAASVPGSLQAILAHLDDPETGLKDIPEVVVLFSGRQALQGRRSKDRAAAKSQPAGARTGPEERFFSARRRSRASRCAPDFRSFCKKPNSALNRCFAKPARRP